MANITISYFNLAHSFLLLLIPIGLSLFFKLFLVKDVLYSVVRMSLQLILIGLFLKYLFKLNNTWINILWLAVMIVTAVFSAIKNSPLKWKKVFLPVFFSFFASVFIVVIYLNSFVLDLEKIFDARYLIVLGGMVLGNSMRGNIVGLSSVYEKIRDNQKRYFYLLSLGANVKEAIFPYVQSSVKLALKPTLAAMATMGIVSLPGMMTGTILGGASPELAVKYQIMIMLGILSSTTMSVVLSIVLTFPFCFDSGGLLKRDIFKEE
ncbi:MAG: UDP-glucose/iron transport system permease protein [Desulfonauticus sp.]|jgi:putative ABC transport system permease protein|nr:MAG: hypothetical protein XD41_0982 [Desulfonauticus sp. 38_4375]MDK2920867.1 UDP-glucose/iron transport system permease protein [Desulfonauticus sp.]